MNFEIEIVEGHDPSSYFWFKPVIINSCQKITWDDITELDEEFSIEEDDVDCFLSYFLYKYFDKELPYNKKRYEYDEGFISEFEWYLTHNFYTYNTLQNMILDIKDKSILLETDYQNPELDDVKKHFSIFYMCPQDCDDYKTGNSDAIQSHVSVVIDFYNRFIARIEKMMLNNPQTNIISIMGP